MKFRIKSNGFYLLEGIPGLSGFKEWDKRVYSITTGIKARHERLSVVREYFFDIERRYRLCDGHLPEYCPVVGACQAQEWLSNNRFQFVVEAA